MADQGAGQQGQDSNPTQGDLRAEFEKKLSIAQEAAKKAIEQIEKCIRIETALAGVSRQVANQIQAYEDEVKARDDLKLGG
ncbi:forkhead box protein C2 [Corchorus capsularis]|uniref:Forkhead box protein C2 n=1 Tax=Corchorus capsularis TaxID=210143 RepID=A0A1R3FY50_COCAP|nr:forkhead box protein C2 [Corchorus capsularis]